MAKYADAVELGRGLGMTVTPHREGREDKAANECSSVHHKMLYSTIKVWYALLV